MISIMAFLHIFMACPDIIRLYCVLKCTDSAIKYYYY